MLARSLLVVFLLVVAGCAPPDPPAHGPFVGVWRVVEIRRVGHDGQRTNDAPQSGIAIFTAGHYSMLWTPGEEPRRVFTTRWQPTAVEKLASFDAFEADCGTYDWSDDAITLHPIVAKVPDLMGGEMHCEYHLAGDSLWITITQATSRDGVHDPRTCSCVTPVKLVRIE